MTWPKTENSVRLVSIPQTAVDLLIQEHGKHPDSPYLFPSPLTGEMYHPDSVVNLHKKILKDVGLEHFRFHDLRHQYVKPTTKTFSENNVVSDVKPRTQLNAQCRHNIRIHAQVNLTIAY